MILCSRGSNRDSEPDDRPAESRASVPLLDRWSRSSMVWAWQRVRDSRAIVDSRSRAWPVAGVVADVGFPRARLLGASITGTSIRRCGSIPRFADFYSGLARLRGPVCGRGESAWPTRGPISPTISWDRGLRNEVRYVNIDRHRDWLLHDYHREALARGQGTWPNSRPGWDRIRPDYRAWLDNLDAEGIQLLVVTRVNPAEGRHNVADAEGFPIERRWADSHPERFDRSTASKNAIHGFGSTGSFAPRSRRDRDPRRPSAPVRLRVLAFSHGSVTAGCALIRVRMRRHRRRLGTRRNLEP